MDLSSRTKPCAKPPAPIRGGGRDDGVNQAGGRNGGVKQASGWNGVVSQGHATAGDLDVEWRITSEINFGSKKTRKVGDFFLASATSCFSWQ